MDVFSSILFIFNHIKGHISLPSFYAFYGSKKCSFFILFNLYVEYLTVHNNLKNNEAPSFQFSKAFLNLLKRESKKDG